MSLRKLKVGIFLDLQQSLTMKTLVDIISKKNEIKSE